jgi:hypothetical protein
MRALVLLAALGACTEAAGTAAHPRWSQAYAVADCAPWDGAATSIFLSDTAEEADPGYPSLRLTVYHDLQSVAGVRWVVGASEPDAAQSVLCDVEGSPCLTATAGWIQLDRSTGNAPLRGTYQVRFPDGRRLAGDFIAPVRLTTVLCG